MFSRLNIGVVTLLSLMAVACGGDGNKTKKLEVPNSPLTSESDSLAYVIGVSMAQNLLKVDSLVDLRVVATAIAQYAEGKSLFTADNARAAYMKYMLHIEPERKRAYEDRYLRELAEKDRDYTRSRFGFIYTVTEIGNQSLLPRNNGDWVEIHYTISRLDGEELYSTYKEEQSLGSALSQLPKGVAESVKFIGKGGKVTSLIPSKLAYDSEGESNLGIEPFETLRYDIELLLIEKNGASKRKKVQTPATF